MASQHPAYQKTPSHGDNLRSALFRQTVENSPDLISIVDRNYVYRMVNAAYLRNHAKTEEQLVGSAISEVMGKQVFEDMIKPNIDRSFAGETVNYQGWFNLAGAGRRYMHVHHYPLPDDEGSIEHVSIVVRDITDQELAKEDLRESEKRYRLLAENVKDVIWKMDLETMRYTYVSPSDAAMRGYSAEEALTQTLEEGLTPWAYEMAARALEEELSPEKIEQGKLPESYRMELEQNCKDGSTVHTEDTITVILDDSGKPVELLGISRDITERKQAEEELRLSEERYPRILDASFDIILVTDENAEIVYANKAWYDNLTYTDEEIKDLGLFGMIHPDDRENVINSYRGAIAGGPMPSVQYRRVKKDGEVRWMESNGAPVQWPGRERVIVNVLRDVTERKRAGEALRESEQRYKKLLEHANDMIATMDVKTGKLTSINEYALQKLGYSEAEFLDKDSFLDVVHPDDQAEMVSALTRYMTDDTRTPNYPFRVQKADGSYLDVEQNTALIFDGEGNPQSLIAITRDVTERKKMEDALRLSEERYRRTLDTSHDVICVLDATGKVVFANESWDKVMGYSVEETNVLGAFDPVHPDDLEALQSAFERTMEGEPVRGHEFRRIGKDGTVTWMEVNGDPIDWPDAEKAIVAVLRDVTERKRMEEDLALSEERYHRILDASHDMILVLDTDAQIIYANKAWLEDSSYTPEKINKIGIFETVHPDDRKKTEDQFRQALSGESAQDVEFRVMTIEGETKWLETKAGPIEWPGAAKAAVITARSITKRKRAEEALERSFSLLSATLESTADGILALDNERNITGFNQKFLELLDLPSSLMGPLAYEQALAYGLEQVEDPEGFLKRVYDIRSRPEEDSFDTLKLKDGRVYERYAKPQKRGNEVIGLVMSFRDITDRIKAEDALRESEQRYRSIFWEAPDLFYTLDLETWIITDANKHALDTLEYDPEMLGKIHISEIVHPEDFEHATDRMREMVIKKDRQPHFPLRLITRTGKVLHIEQSGVIFYDKEGRAKTFLGLAHDVTYRIEQDEMIRKRNEKLMALYEVSKTASATLDIETLNALMVDVIPAVTNSATMAIVLLDEKSQTFEYAAHYGLSEETIEATNHVKRDEGIHSYVVKHKKPILIRNLIERQDLSRAEHVKKLNIESSIAAPLIVEDEVIGFLWVSRAPGDPFDSDDLDLVNAMATHIAVAIANANLYSQVLQRETRLQTILETSRDGIAVLAPSRRFSYFNKSISSMFGYTENDRLDDLDINDCFSPESQLIFNEIRKQVDEGEELMEDLRFKARRQDGSVFDAEAELGAFVEDGQRFIVAVVRDVTEKNRLRFQLEQSGKLAAIGELAVGIAHEINNPLATLDIQSGLMRDIVEEERDRTGAALLEQVEQYLDIVEEQVRRCESVTGALLSFSRKRESKSTTVEINELLKKTVQLMTDLTDKKPEINLLLGERIPDFFGDPRRLGQVFVNLLGNALKAIRIGGAITISTRLDADENILIEFKDTGPGIAPETKDRIFDPFFTTDQTGGSGLGLSISHYIISEEMNGSLDVESSPGQGAAFLITLKGARGAEKESRHAE